MNSWNAGYVTDVGYTFGAYRELAPTILNFTALIAGFRSPDPNDALTYCELGCGQGFSTNLLAAANPHIDFYATDFNPSHIAGAKALAAAARTSNVHFFDKSFGEFGEESGLPEFDIIALHGIYSWISAEHRRDIVNFIRTRLKVGGLVYISYNALPGWAPVMPLRRLMVDHANGVVGTTTQRVDQSLAFIQRLADVSPKYFGANPVAAERFEKIKASNRSYTAHEYYNRHLVPFYHADVCAELDDAKLSFVGSASLVDTMDAANLTPEQDAFLKTMPTLTMRETMRDFVLNQQFRRDVYVKGPVPLNAIESRDRWARMRFALTVRRDVVPLKIKGALGEATLKEEIYKPILDGLANGPRTPDELMSDPAIAAMGLLRVIQATTILVGAGHLQPSLNADGDADRTAHTQSFNTAVMNRARSSDDLQSLASPVTGAATSVDRVSQLLLLALQNKAEDPAQFAWNQLNAAGHKVMKDNKLLETPEDNLAEIQSMFKKFTDQQLAVLRSIGISGMVE